MPTNAMVEVESGADVVVTYHGRGSREYPDHEAVWFGG